MFQTYKKHAILWERYKRLLLGVRVRLYVWLGGLRHGARGGGRFHRLGGLHLLHVRILCCKVYPSILCFHFCCLIHSSIFIFNQISEFNTICKTLILQTYMPAVDIEQGIYIIQRRLYIKCYINVKEFIWIHISNFFEIDIQKCNLNGSVLTGFILKALIPRFLHKMPWKKNISYNNCLAMDLQPCLYSDKITCFIHLSINQKIIYGIFGLGLVCSMLHWNPKNNL